MAQICAECESANTDSDRFCRNCGSLLNGSAKPAPATSLHDQGRSTRPWVALTLIGALLLCCLSLIGVALLDEIASAHPLRTLLVGTATPTPTLIPTPTFAPSESAIATPAYSATPELAMDSFEPDDTLAQANEINTDGRSQTRSLSPSEDRDYLSFQAREGTLYTIETSNLGEDCDTVITLYDEGGTELASDDDGSDEPLASLLVWIADDDGTLFVEVALYGEAVELEDTAYSIAVLESEPVTYEEDEYEPDDTMTQAHEILLRVPQIHSIHVQGDHDWVSVQAEEGVTYVIQTSDLVGEIDTIIYLYNEDGEELAQDDDGGEESLASRLTWSADSSGILHVMIRDYWDDRSGPDMKYTISVAEGVPFEADRHEPDDTRSEAREIEVGQNQSHDLHVTADHDWVFFQTKAGTTYVIETLDLGSRIDTMIHLFDAAGEELASDDDGAGTPLASRIAWTAEQDGVLYVMVRDLEDDEAGPGTEYTISVREESTALLFADEYEPDGTLAEAREIDAGEVQIHNIHSEGDRDWLFFQALEGTTYVVETSNLGQEVDTIIQLFDEDGEELAQDDDGADEPRASRVTWTAEEDGTLYLMVRDYKDNRADVDMGYDISIRESGTEPNLGETRLYIADGTYQIVCEEASRFVVGVSERLSFEDFTLEVDAAQVSGDDDNEYGLVYGYQDADNCYEVAISGDGYAGLFAKEEGTWQTIVSFEHHEAVNQGNAVNRLRLEVLEGRISFYVNDLLAFQDDDSRFGEGLIGFGCGSFREPSLHCSFDNLRVWNVGGSLAWEDAFDDNSGNWTLSPVP